MESNRTLSARQVTNLYFYSVVCYCTRVLPCPCGQVARALQYMHSKQIVHRDVKPENVMIIDRRTEDGLYPEV